MVLGNFSISLAVKDIRASRDFYQKLGFEIIDDHEDEKWMILRNGKAVIGLFEGMFPKNIITFQPPDVRSVQKILKKQGVKLETEADETSGGPAFVELLDPDGNPILLDQIDPDYKPTA